MTGVDVLRIVPAQIPIDSAGLVAITLSILGAVYGAVRWLANRLPARMTPAEQMAAVRKSVADVEAKLDRSQAEHDRQIGVMQERLDILESKLRSTEDYAEQLRAHISERKPPPPPEWPEELR